MTDREVALSVLAFLDIPAPEFVEIVAASKFDSVSLRVAGSTEANPSELSDPARLAATTRRLADTGLGVIDAEVLRLGPDLGIDEIRRTVDASAALGAHHLLTVNAGWQGRSQLVDQLSEVRVLADSAGIRPCLEFMKFSECRDLQEAVTAAVEADVAVLVDLLHLSRSGGGPEQLREAVTRYGDERFPYVQICDAPIAAPPDGQLRDEAVRARLLPGDGELPLQDCLKALPAGIPVAVEAPTVQLRALPPGERANRTMRAIQAMSIPDGPGRGEDRAHG